MNKSLDNNKNIKNLLIYVLTENTINKIIASSITKHDIKNLVGEELINIIKRKEMSERDYQLLSEDSNITLELIKKHPEVEWSFTISCNPNLTVEFIENNLDMDWSWFWISTNPNLPMDFIEKHNKKDKNHGFEHNPNVTPEYIEKHPKGKWDLDKYSGNPSLTLEFIEKNYHKNWNWTTILQYYNIRI